MWYELKPWFLAFGSSSVIANTDQMLGLACAGLLLFLSGIILGMRITYRRKYGSAYTR